MWVAYLDENGTQRYGEFVEADRRRIERTIFVVDSVETADGRLAPASFHGVKIRENGRVILKDHFGVLVYVPLSRVVGGVLRRGGPLHPLAEIADRLGVA